MKGFVQIVEALIIAVVLVLAYQWVKVNGAGLLKIPEIPKKPDDLPGFKAPPGGTAPVKQGVDKDGNQLPDKDVPLKNDSVTGSDGSIFGALQDVFGLIMGLPAIIASFFTGENTPTVYADQEHGSGSNSGGGSGAGGGGGHPYAY